MTTTIAPELSYSDPHISLGAMHELSLPGLEAQAYAIATANLAAQRDPAAYWRVNQAVERLVRTLARAGVTRAASAPAIGHEGVQALAALHPLLAEWWGSETQARAGDLDFSHMPKWRAGVPSARALWPLMHPGETPPQLDCDALSADDWAVLTHTADAIGIRSRAALTTALLTSRFASHADATWLCWGTGALVPVLRAAHSLAEGAARPSVSVKDGDVDSLALATLLSTREDPGLELNATQANLYDLETLTRSGPCDMIDLVGLFEYLPAHSIPGRPIPTAARLVRAAIDATRPGGTVMLGNMLDSRPQLDFVLRCIQWPFIQPRSLQEFVGILHEAGVDDEQITLYLPDDGVYAVATIDV